MRNVTLREAKTTGVPVVAAFGEDQELWEISFPRGVGHLDARYAGTCTGGDHSKREAEEMARDFVVCIFAGLIRHDQVRLRIVWENESGFRRWRERRHR